MPCLPSGQFLIEGWGPYSSPDAASGVIGSEPTLLPFSWSVTYLSGASLARSCWMISQGRCMGTRKNDGLSELKPVHVPNLIKRYLIFKNCLKRFKYWLITSVGKNNYCHMVCGLGFTGIKSLLLPIVLGSRRLTIPENPMRLIEKPQSFGTC